MRGILSKKIKESTESKKKFIGLKEGKKQVVKIRPIASTKFICYSHHHHHHHSPPPTFFQLPNRVWIIFTQLDQGLMEWKAVSSFSLKSKEVNLEWSN